MFTDLNEVSFVIHSNDSQKQVLQKNLINQTNAFGFIEYQGFIHGCMLEEGVHYEMLQIERLLKNLKLKIRNLIIYSCLSLLISVLKMQR